MRARIYGRRDNKNDGREASVQVGATFFFFFLFFFFEGDGKLKYRLIKTTPASKRTRYSKL